MSFLLDCKLHESREHVWFVHGSFSSLRAMPCTWQVIYKRGECINPPAAGTASFSEAFGCSYRLVLVFCLVHTILDVHVLFSFLACELLMSRRLHVVISVASYHASPE